MGKVKDLGLVLQPAHHPPQEGHHGCEEDDDDCEDEDHEASWQGRFCSREEGGEESTREAGFEEGREEQLGNEGALCASVLSAPYLGVT